MQSLDSNMLREQFPILKDNPQLSYLDSAASSQKPQVVIDRMNRFYREENANVHRGIYSLSETATTAFEEARRSVASFLGGVKESEVIITKGTTEAVNLVSKSWAEAFLGADDEILLTVSEHHSNIVPWQMAAHKVGAKVKYIPLREDLRLDMDAAKALVNERTKIIACAHASNVLGIVHPVKEIIALAKSCGAVSFIDGAQGAAHLEIDVKSLDCDFYAFSGHKVMGPTGIGILYGKEELLDRMPPYHGGGDMIETVTLEGSTWAPLPSKFEAGTPPISAMIGLGTAVDFLSKLDRVSLGKHDRKLGRQVIDILKSNSNIKVFAEDRDDWTGVVSFFHEKIHPHDFATVCDYENVCIRAGHHCAQPLMKYLEVPASCRVSPYFYNNVSDIEAFEKALHRAEELFC